MRTLKKLPKIGGAFFYRNFRKLGFESKTILIAHLLTVIFCFFPWAWIEPSFGPPLFYSAFSGPAGLIGAFIFLISLTVVVIFADQLFESHRLKFRVSENAVFLTAGVQQLIFLVLAWSVLMSVGRGFENFEIRFGIFGSFMMQIVGLVAVYLQSQQDKKEKVQSFFQHPQSSATKKSENPTDTPKKDEPKND